MTALAVASRSARVGLLLLAIPVGSATAEDAPLTLADLEAYRVALNAKVDPAAPPVRFRDLWDRPEAYVGRPVRVEGRVARLFHQSSVGEFPALTEAWVTSPGGDPFCLVFPLADSGQVLKVGDPVRFRGTFLKRLRYPGGDVARVAPLIVGPEAPSTERAATREPAGATLGGPSWTTADWMLGLGAVAMVAMVLARRHLARPASPPEILEPAPRFIDGEFAEHHEEGACDDESA